MTIHGLLARPGGMTNCVYMAEKHYRPNVAAIIRRKDGCLLIGRRSDFPESWQFPQGGIDPGEPPEDALRRELQEETGLTPADYRITARSRRHRYDFPSGADRRGFCGQEQTYYICTLADHSARVPDPRNTCGEFSQFRWVTLEDFPLELAPPMKHEVYVAVLKELASHLTEPEQKH
jgi:putative (di)nucleoside polyphosphate hydrolase